MAFGSLKNFFTALAAAPTLAGIDVVFGEENRFAQEYALPYVVVVPRGGPFSPGNGYIKGIGQTVPCIWAVRESIDIEIWAAGDGPDAVGIDDADAVENTAALVLQGLYDQQQNGQSFIPKSRGWATLQDATSGRFGRALVLSVQVEISIPGATLPTATVTGVVLTESITTP